MRNNGVNNTTTLSHLQQINIFKLYKVLFKIIDILNLIITRTDIFLINYIKTFY